MQQMCRCQLLRPAERTGGVEKLWKAIGEMQIAASSFVLRWTAICVKEGKHSTWEKALEAIVTKKYDDWPNLAVSRTCAAEIESPASSFLAVQFFVAPQRLLTSSDNQLVRWPGELTNWKPESNRWA